MYSLIYQLKRLELGTGLMSIGMEKTYPGLFRAFDIRSESIPEHRRIWQIQNPYLYRFGKIDRVNDHVFARENFARFFPGKKMTNGFSYLKSHRDTYSHFLPTIYDSHFGVSDVPSVGYYARDCRIQSNLAFSDFTMTLPDGTRVVTMGDKRLTDDIVNPRLERVHTYDREVFWKSCSHFFYYRCSDIEDPLPHTLLEAIQSGHRIISPRNPQRDFEDGIDDLLSCIEYDEAYVPEARGVSCEFLNSSAWCGFMERIAERDFIIDYPVNRRTFREWIEETL